MPCQRSSRALNPAAEMDDTASVGSDVVRSNEAQVADTLAAAAQALAAISQDSRDSLSSAASAVDGEGGSAQPPTGVATAAHATTHATARTATPSENNQGGGNELGALQRGVKRRRHKTSNVRTPALLAKPSTLDGCDASSPFRSCASVCVPEDSPQAWQQLRQCFFRLCLTMW